MAGWEYLRRNTSGSSLTSANRKKHIEILVKLCSNNKKNNVRGYYTDDSPLGLGQYKSLESSVPS